MVSKSDYTPEEVQACKAVLVEFIHIFGEIKDEMVIIGGWTPTLLLPESGVSMHSLPRAGFNARFWWPGFAE